MRIATNIIAVLFTSLLFLAMDAMADNEIYRWVDENGVIHFGEQPPEKGNAQSVSIPQSAGIDAQPSADANPANPEDPLEPQPSVAQQLRDARAEKRAEAEENERIVAEACAQRRTLVSQLEPSTRVMVKMEDGTVTRLDDNVRLETLDEAKTYIANNCDK
ncbi:MAG: DUF4124 domain-containing protein [Xanthomonadales bacterium]|nr:DUF4124 domain-containing protein [Xanthomonadales bacterium]